MERKEGREGGVIERKRDGKNDRVWEERKGERGKEKKNGGWEKVR